MTATTHQPLGHGPASLPGAQDQQRTLVPAISLHSVVKNFKDQAGETVRAVNNLTLQVGAGEVVAFLGPNGAGKSTTIDMLLGLTTPTSGTVELFGGEPLTAVKNGRVSVVMQSGGLLPDLTVEATVTMIGSLYNGADTAACIERAGLTKIANRKVSQCSGGEQQRLRFALALLPDPELIILDEPTAGMDVEARREFWAAVREDAGHGLTVLFATHYLEEADQFADRVIMIDHGELVADGSAASLRATVDGRVVSAVISRQDVDRVRTSGLATVTELRGDRTFFDTDDSDRLLQVLVTSTDAQQVEIVPRSLEDAFLKITNSHARKDI